MISFSVYSKMKMNGFIDWNSWIKKLFSFVVVNKYMRPIYNENRNSKTKFFDSLYLNEFMKLNAKHFFMLKSKNAFQLQLISKIKFFDLIKIHEHNNEQVKNVDDIDINNTIHLHDSIAHYYQKKEDVNFVLTNEQKFMSPGF